MTTDEATTEEEIVRKGLTAPRLTPMHIDAQILTEQYYVFPGTTLTVCALTLQNGYHVVGESAPASPENFDQEIGKRISRQTARNKIWALEGYLLRSRLSDANQFTVDQKATLALGTAQNALNIALRTQGQQLAQQGKIRS